VVHTLSYANTGAGTDGIELSAGSATNATVVGNGRHGVTMSASGGNSQFLLNGLAVNNGGYGFVGTPQCLAVKLATYNNTSGRANALDYDLDPVVLTGDPFVSVAGNDYALNNLAGAGAALRATAFNLFKRGLTVGYLDLGAAQHADPVGGGGGGSVFGELVIR
jgi:hypothetical protein